MFYLEWLQWHFKVTRLLQALHCRQRDFFEELYAAVEKISTNRAYGAVTVWQLSFLSAHAQQKRRTNSRGKA